MAKKLNYLPILLALVALAMGAISTCGRYTSDVMRRPETICAATCIAWSTAGCVGHQDPFGIGLKAMSTTSECMQLCDEHGGLPTVDVGCMMETKRCDQFVQCIGVENETDNHQSTPME